MGESSQLPSQPDDDNDKDDDDDDEVDADDDAAVPVSRGHTGGIAASIEQNQGCHSPASL